jgi:tetratricopeptide (TPR) repeat protein
VSEPTQLDFDVLFGRSGSSYEAQVLRSPAGEGQSTAFERPLSDLALNNAAASTAAAPAKLLGRQLFDAVFSGPVGECLSRSSSRAADEQSALRVRLLLSDCPELADLPWELLYDRRDDRFLALTDHTAVVRYVPPPVQPHAVPVSLPLRVLVIRSEPADCPQLDLAAEWAQVTAALDELTDAAVITFTELAAPTLSELRRALHRDTFHVLHFLGHRGLDHEDGEVLLFSDRSGRSLPVTGERLGVLLHDHASIRLAVLSARGAGPARPPGPAHPPGPAGPPQPPGPAGPVADALLRAGLPAVITMQFEISDATTAEFGPALYAAIAAGRPADAAIAQARQAMHMVSPLGWAAPVLHLGADDAALFDIAERAGPHASEAAASTEEGDRLRERGLYPDAETAYRKAVAADPGHARAHVGLAFTLIGLERYPEAEAASREAIRVDPGLARAHACLGGALYGRQRYPEAEAACREAIRLDPGLARAHSYLSAARYGQQRYPEAEAACREAIRLDPAQARSHALLGSMLRAMKRYPEAETAYRAAIGLEPDLIEAHASLGAILYILERHAEAEAACREAVRLRPGLARTHASLGAVLLRLRRYADAEAACAEAVRLDPALATAHADLGYARLGLRQYPEAEAACREAVRLQPGLARAHNNLGDVLRARKRRPEARAAYQEAARIDPGYGKPRF